jgi:hypothetical protein
MAIVKKKATPKKTAVLNRYKALKENTGRAADYISPQAQRQIMASQG